MYARLLLWLYVHPKTHAWLKRYGLAELCGTLAVVAVAVLGSLSPGAAALAGNVAESLGYYLPITIREVREQHRRHRRHRWPKRYRLIIFVTIRDLLLEFGLGELLDFFLVRPLLMFLLALLFHHVLIGMIVGKLLADFVFYLPTIRLHLLKRRVLYADELEAEAEAEADADAGTDPTLVLAQIVAAKIRG